MEIKIRQGHEMSGRKSLRPQMSSSLCDTVSVSYNEQNNKAYTPNPSEGLNEDVLLRCSEHSGAGIRSAW